MNKYYNIEESGVSMEDKPRYSKVSDAIALILLMQSKFNGISLSDIQEELNSKNPNQICVSQKQKYEDSNKIWKTTFGNSSWKNFIRK